MAAQEDMSKALVTLPADMPALPDLKGKLGGATIKASEEQSSVKEMHKEVRIVFIWYIVPTPPKNNLLGSQLNLL